MDKFGIFNFLGSLLGNNSGNFSADSEPEKVKNGDNDLISNLISSLTSGVKSSNPIEKPTLNKEQLPRHLNPLQHSMLSTMKSHDEFIKRVKNECPKK